MPASMGRSALQDKQLKESFQTGILLAYGIRHSAIPSCIWRTADSCITMQNMMQCQLVDIRYSRKLQDSIHTNDSCWQPCKYSSAGTPKGGLVRRMSPFQICPGGTARCCRLGLTYAPETRERHVRCFLKHCANLLVFLTSLQCHCPLAARRLFPVSTKAAAGGLICMFTSVRSMREMHAFLE